MLGVVTFLIEFHGKFGSFFIVNEFSTERLLDWKFRRQPEIEIERQHEKLSFLGIPREESSSTKTGFDFCSIETFVVSDRLGYGAVYTVTQPRTPEESHTTRERKVS